MAKKSRKENKVDNPDDTNVPTFEAAIGQLSDAVRQLEDGNLSLDDSLESYERAIRYLNQCQQILASAERKVEVLSGFDADGNPVMKQLDDDSMTLEEKADGRSRRRTAHPKSSRRKNAAKKTTPDDARSATSPSPQSPSTPPNDNTPTSAVVPNEDDVDGGGTLF